MHIETLDSKCVDCYKCLKSCPVKAIKFVDGKSFCVDELCIYCGTCIVNCPQSAKREESHLERVRERLKEGKKMAVSLAPSFAAFCERGEFRKVPALLRKLGFTWVEETAIGAYYVAMANRKELEERDFVIGTSCPSAVFFVEKYRPELIPYLSKARSPILAHAKDMRRRYGEEVELVYITPCVAKKEEIERYGEVEHVITFEELMRWAEEEGLSLSEMSESSWDELPYGYARFFPIDGGLLRTAGLNDSYLSQNYICISGTDNVISFLKSLDGPVDGVKFVDLLMCEGGCVNGPRNGGKRSVLNRVRLVENLSEEEVREPEADVDVEWVLDREYSNLDVRKPVPAEEDIRRILAAIGKFSPEDELNCGACGYPTCRDKAIAVYYGMAEPQMCIPYMKRKAESVANLIVENTPNGVVIVDSELRVVEHNKAFARIFGIEGPAKGKRLSLFVGDVPLFVKALRTGETHSDVRYFPKIDRWLKCIVFLNKALKQVVGIFVDITAERKTHDEVMRMKKEIASKTEQVILKQMRVAQEIAGLLGETTAETKAMLSKLREVISEDQKESGS